MRNIVSGPFHMPPGDLARQAAAAPATRRQNGSATDVPPAEVPAPTAGETVAAAPAVTAAAVDIKAIPGGRWNGLADANGNRQNPSGLFQTITFKAASASAKIYKDDDGRHSQKQASVLCYLGESGGAIKGSVRLVQNKNEKAPHLEFSFFGAKNQGTCLAVEGAQAEAELDQFKKLVLRRFVEWHKTNKAEVAAFENAAITLEGIGSLLTADDDE